MYFRLTTDLAMQNAYVASDFDEYVSLMSGAPLSGDLPSPFRFTIDIDSDDDVDDDEEDDEDEDESVTPPDRPVLFAFFQNQSLMHRRLVDAMMSAGVDNLQLYPAEIRDESSGETIEDYVVANVVGLVSCANVTASTTEPLADVYFFHELVIDPTRTGDLLLFRLAESQMDIIVHEKVASAIRSADLPGLVLEPLREEIGGKVAV
jgi:hypothetical protein